LGSWAILTSSMWPYLPLSTFILFFFLFIDINYFLENTTTTSNRQRIITISFQPRQDALPLYEIASSSTVYGFYFLLIFPIIPFTFLLQFSFQSFHFLFYGYKKVYPFIFHSLFFPSIIYLTLLNYAFFWICLIHLNLFMDRKIESCYQRVVWIWCKVLYILFYFPDFGHNTAGMIVLCSWSWSRETTL
jgi:hypothetical protein